MSDDILLMALAVITVMLGVGWWSCAHDRRRAAVLHSSVVAEVATIALAFGDDDGRPDEERENL